MNLIALTRKKILLRALIITISLSGISYYLYLDHSQVYLCEVYESVLADRQGYAERFAQRYSDGPIEPVRKEPYQEKDCSSWIQKFMRIFQT